MSLKLIRTFFEKHQRRVLRELKKQGIGLTVDNINEIIRVTGFGVRSRNYPSACPCYLPVNGESVSKPCHLGVEDLNCFLCGCPEYPSENPSESCGLNHRYGSHIPYTDAPKGILLDCNGCSHPHYRESVEKYLKKNMNRLQKMSERI